MTSVILRARDNPRVRAWKKLRSEGGERRRLQCALLEGVHLVQTYRDQVGPPRELIVSEDAAGDGEVAALVARGSCPVARVSAAVFAAIADTRSPAGIAAVIDVPAQAPELAGIAHCVLVEGVQDAGNLGAIVRSAAAFGVGVVVVGPGSADPWSPKVLRAAMGGHFSLRVAMSDNLAGLLDGFGGTALCTAPRGGKTLADLDLTGPIAWILGSEGGGVTPSLAARADALACIPMHAGTESLNVAAAAAVCFYERARQLSTSGARS